MVEVFCRTENPFSVLMGRRERILGETTVVIPFSQRHQQLGEPQVTGAERARTADLLVANQALSQLSYGPGRSVEKPKSPIAKVRLLDVFLEPTAQSEPLGRHPPPFLRITKTKTPTTATRTAPINSRLGHCAVMSAILPLPAEVSIQWARQDSNLRLRRYQRRALAN